MPAKRKVGAAASTAGKKKIKVLPPAASARVTPATKTPFDRTKSITDTLLTVMRDAPYDVVSIITGYDKPARLVVVNDSGDLAIWDVDDSTFVSYAWKEFGFASAKPELGEVSVFVIPAPKSVGGELMFVTGSGADKLRCYHSATPCGLAFVPYSAPVSDNVFEPEWRILTSCPLSNGRGLLSSVEVGCHTRPPKFSTVQPLAPRLHPTPEPPLSSAVV